MKIRLHQFLSKSGLFSRRQDMVEAILRGDVKIDSETVTKPHYGFNPKKRKVYYKGEEVKETEETIYLILNKPLGYLSTKLTEKDIELGKKSAFDLITGFDEKAKNSLFAVGRLDEDTSGLLIFTNDGRLGYKIASPKSSIKKTYHAVLEKELSEKDIAKIEKGVKISLGGFPEKFYTTKPCKIEKISGKEAYITLTEGKKREVRKIFVAMGNAVISLRRIAIGKILLKKLDIRDGEFRIVDRQFIKERL